MPTLTVQERFADLDGARVRYLDAGSGTPLVLLHGLGQSSTAWRRSLDALAAKHRVIVPDLPGFGESDIPADVPFGPRYFGRIVGRLLSEIGLERVDAVGHSAGALALTLAALESPHSFHRIVLVDPAGFTPVPDNVLGAAAARLIRLVASVPRSRAVVGALYRTAFFDPHAADDDTIDEIARRQSDPRVKVTARQSFIRHYDFCRKLAPYHERLADLDAPILVIWGSDDRLFRSSDSAVARRVFRRVRVEVIERCGHCPQIERPDRFTDLVLDFLAAK